MTAPSNFAKMRTLHQNMRQYPGMEGLHFTAELAASASGKIGCLSSGANEMTFLRLIKLSETNQPNHSKYHKQARLLYVKFLKGSKKLSSPIGADQHECILGKVEEDPNTAEIKAGIAELGYKPHEYLCTVEENFERSIELVATAIERKQGAMKPRATTLAFSGNTPEAGLLQAAMPTAAPLQMQSLPLPLQAGDKLGDGIEVLKGQSDKQIELIERGGKQQLAAIASLSSIVNAMRDDAEDAKDAAEVKAAEEAVAKVEATKVLRRLERQERALSEKKEELAAQRHAETTGSLASIHEACVRSHPPPAAAGQVHAPLFTTPRPTATVHVSSAAPAKMDTKMDAEMAAPGSPKLPVPVPPMPPMPVEVSIIGPAERAEGEHTARQELGRAKRASTVPGVAPANAALLKKPKTGHRPSPLSRTAGNALANWPRRRIPTAPGGAPPSDRHLA